MRLTDSVSSSGEDLNNVFFLSFPLLLHHLEMKWMGVDTTGGLSFLKRRRRRRRGKNLRQKRMRRQKAERDLKRTTEKRS